MLGLVQLYIGDGKGKTSAAFGLLMRAFGWGLRCVVIQFLKGAKSGEVVLARNLGIGNVFQFGLKKFFSQDTPDERIVGLVADGVQFAKKVLSSGDYELVILDEILTAYSLGLVSEDVLISLVEHKSKRTELVMTGLSAPQTLIERADLVTEMKKIKHHYDKGIKARRGIEY